jgi:MFS family permease
MNINLSMSRQKSFRLAVGVMFFVAGICFASWASRIASVQHMLGLSDAALGAILIALPVGLMASLPFSGWVITRTGSRNLLLIAIIGYGLALCSIGLIQNTFQLVICLMLFGFCSNAVNISVNTQAVAAEGLYKKTIMASFHGLWSLAGFIGAAIGTLMIGNDVSLFYHFIFVFTLMMIGVSFAFKFLKKDSVKQDNKPLFTMPDKSLMNLGLIAFCSMICEGAMFDWSVVYFKKVVMADAAWIGAGYTAFMGTMALGRFIADWFAGKFGIQKTLQLSGLLTASGLLIAVVFPGLFTAIIGFLLVGAGVSSVVPLVYSAAGKANAANPGVALAAVSTIGFLGFLIGPPLIGFIAGLSSLKVSFLFIAVMGMSVVFVSSKAKFTS